MFYGYIEKGSAEEVWNMDENYHLHSNLSSHYLAKSKRSPVQLYIHTCDNNMFRVGRHMINFIHQAVDKYNETNAGK